MCVTEIRVDDEVVEDHFMIGHMAIDKLQRVVVTAGGVVHDMRCDGTAGNGEWMWMPISLVKFRGRHL